MKLNTMTTIVKDSSMENVDAQFFLEMGNIAGENGNDQEAIDWYTKGLNLATSIQDKLQIRQFSNLILTYL